MCSTTSSTDFQTQVSGHVLEWDMHPSGDLFIFARTHGEFHWNSGAHSPPRPIYQQIATALYILGASGGGAERAHIFLDIGCGTIWEYT